MLNLVRNGELEVWGAGPVPSFMAAQVTNTVLSILNIGDERHSLPRLAFGSRASRGERHVAEGAHALRATLAAGAAADAFRLHPLNVNALTYLGATAPVVSLTPGKEYSFSFQARCTGDGNLATVRILARNALGAAVLLSLDDNVWNAGGATDIDFGLRRYWQRKAINFVAPMTDDAGAMIDNVVWQISNGTAGDQIIDLDDIRMHRADDQSAS